MTLKAGKNGALYVAQYDLSGSVNKFEPALSRALIDGTCMGASGKAYAPSLHDDSFSFDGFYDGTADIGTELHAIRNATSVHVCSLCIGSSQSDNAIFGEGAWAEEWPLEASVDDLLRFTASFKFNDAATVGYILQAKATQTADGNGTGVDGSAASSSGAEANLHVFSCDASDVVIKVQDDDNADFDSPNDLITFTTVAGATSEHKTASGAVQRYVRITWSGTWTGDKSAQFAVVFARL